MSYVVDASVGVAAARAGEPGHVESLAFLRRCLTEGTPLIHSPLFSIEVAAALSRRGADAAVLRRYLAPLLAPPNRVAVLGPKAAARVVGVAIRYGLRGADAVYAWLAEQEDVPLVTLDREHLDRFSGSTTPADA